MFSRMAGLMSPKKSAPGGLDPQVGDAVEFTNKGKSLKGTVLKRQGLKLRVKRADTYEVWVEVKDVTSVGGVGAAAEPASVAPAAAPAAPAAAVPAAAAAAAPTVPAAPPAPNAAAPAVVPAVPPAPKAAAPAAAAAASPSVPAATPAAAPSPPPLDLARVATVAAANPGNRCCKHLLAISEAGKLASLSPSTLAQLAQCAKTGIENPDSGLGCYAMSPADYDELNFFFDPVCNDYHNNPAGDKVHATNWSLKGVEGLPEDGVLDMRKLGLSDPLSMRVRVGRNLKAFPLPGAMTKSDRIKFEKTMLGAFASLVANRDYGGSVFSMTPHADWQGVTGEAENPNLISSSKYDELVKAHVMFKDMDADPYLKSAGIASDWPCGRGCYQSEDGGFIIWFGEEDQLRIMCMGKGFVLNEVFDRLNTALQLVESIEGIEFATSSKYGYVTSCPTNLGTGMRASVHLKIPNLTADGTDAKAVAAAKPLGLSVRGTGGEHTPIGADGTVDISPSNRLFITEAEIVTKLYSGVKLLLEEEMKAAPAGSGGCGAAAAVASTGDAAAVAAPATRKRGTSMGLLFRGESMEEATKQLPVVKEAAEAKAKKEAADAEATVSAAAAAATATTAPAAGAAGEGGGKKEQGEEEEEDNDEELDAMYEDLLKQAAKNTKGGRARGLTLDVVGEWDQVKEILASGTVDETTLGKIFDESFRDAAVGEHAFAALPPDAMQALTKLGNTMVPRREDSSDDSESDDGFDDDDFDAKPKPKPKKASTAAAATNRVSTVAEEADEFDYERPSVATSNGVRVITKEAFSKFVQKLDEASELGEMKQTRALAANLMKGVQGGPNQGGLSIGDRAKSAGDVDKLFAKKGQEEGQEDVITFSENKAKGALRPSVPVLPTAATTTTTTAPTAAVSSTPVPAAAVKKPTPPTPPALPPTAPLAAPLLQQQQAATVAQRERLSALTERLESAEKAAAAAGGAGAAGGAALSPAQRQRFDGLLARLASAETAAGVSSSNIGNGGKLTAAQAARLKELMVRLSGAEHSAATRLLTAAAGTAVGGAGAAQAERVGGLLQRLGASEAALLDKALS